LNKILNLDSDLIKLNPDEVFLCHSPMRDILHKYRNKNILVTGIGDPISVMREYGQHNYVTVEEYVALFPKAFCHFFVDEM
jgi:ribonucleotide monophosphatase NagD (HAD superfamily)